MKKHVFLFLVIFIFGCATDQDLKRVQQYLGDEILELKQDQSAIRKEVKGYAEAGSSVRRSQAETGADVTDLRGDVQKLRGDIEKLRRNVLTSRKNEVAGKQLSDITFRINYLENFLGIEEKVEPVGGSSSKDVTKKINRETAYAAAYKTFKEGKYDKAREEFQKFLKLFPNTEYSDNAQFWIGECYFLKGEYEKAILGYEKVIKSYPNGNKVSYALLKQGLSFLKLGDRPSAKLILQQVIRDFPNTNQARIARTKLVGIK